MADTRHLKRQFRTWYLHLRLPRDVAAALGKTHISKTLRTDSLREAQQRRDQLPGELQAQFAELRGKPRWQTPEGVLSTARVLRAQVTTGEVSQADAIEAMDRMRFQEAQSHDPAGLTLPEDVAGAYSRAMDVVKATLGCVSPRR